MPTETAGGTGIWDAGHRALSIGLVLTVSMAAFEALAVATILPATVADIGGLRIYGWTFSAFMLAEIVGISVAGRAGDARGLAPPFARRRGAVLRRPGRAPAPRRRCRADRWRVAAGARRRGASRRSPTPRSRAATTEAARPRMLALLSTAWVVPGLIGPALAGAIAAYAGWRWVFLAPGAAQRRWRWRWRVPALRRLGPGARRRAAPTRRRRRVGLAAGAAVMLCGLALDRASPALAVGAPAALSSRVPTFRRLTPAGTLRARRGLPAAVAVMGLLSAAFFAAEVFVPLSLTDVRQRSIAFAGVGADRGDRCNWTAGAWMQARLARAPQPSARWSRVGLVLIGGRHRRDRRRPASRRARRARARCVGRRRPRHGPRVLDHRAGGARTRAAGRAKASASAALQLANVLGTAVGTGLGGAVLARSIARGGSTAHAIALTDALALLAAPWPLVMAMRLPRRPTSC